MSLLSAVPAALVWTQPNLEQFGFIVFIAIMGTGSQLSMVHAYRVGDALAEWPGGGLDTAGGTVFRVPRRMAAELAEITQLLDRHVRIAREVQQTVEQHGTMAI